MHVIVWQFEVAPEKTTEFLAAYRGDGLWAQLFQRAPGYLGTELLSSADEATRYITIDRWRSAEDLDRFRQNFADAYHALDVCTEALTTRETEIGSFASESWKQID